MSLDSFLETRQSFFDHIKRLIEEYRKKAGVKVKPIISVNNKWKRKIAHVKYHLFDRIGVIETPELTINLKMLEEYFKADRELPEKVIRFVIAHEIGHLKQREKYGFKIIGYPSVLMEDEADRIAEELTGISRTDKDLAEEKLVKKIYRVREKPRGKGTLTYKGKVVARVIGWESVKYKGKMIIPFKSVKEIRDMPKRTKAVYLTVFDEYGNPKKDIKKVSREELEENYILMR